MQLYYTYLFKNAVIEPKTAITTAPHHKKSNKIIHKIKFLIIKPKVKPQYRITFTYSYLCSVLETCTMLHRLDTTNYSWIKLLQSNR